MVIRLSWYLYLYENYVNSSFCVTAELSFIKEKIKKLDINLRWKFRKSCWSGQSAQALADKYFSALIYKIPPHCE